MSPPFDAPAPSDGQQRVTDGAEPVAEALLREHPNALVCGLGVDGLTVAIPHSVQLWGQIALEGRAVIDHVVTGDRKLVIDTWFDALRNGVSECQVRLLSDPKRSFRLHFLDLRQQHGIILSVLVPTDGEADERMLGEIPPPVASPFCTLIEDARGHVLDCDESFTAMFGYEPAELAGESAMHQIHPDDQARALERWLALASSRRPQRVRVRRMCKDGSWLWVDVTLHNYLNDPDRQHVLVELTDVSSEMTAWDALQDGSDTSS
jgi:PAS domain S-box-containing protein